MLGVLAPISRERLTFVRLIVAKAAVFVTSHVAYVSAIRLDFFALSHVCLAADRQRLIVRFLVGRLD